MHWLPVGCYLLFLTTPATSFISLVQPDCAVLECLGRRIPFEVAVGYNGLLWVRAKTEAHMIIVANALTNSEHLEGEQTEAMVHALAQSAS